MIGTIQKFAMQSPIDAEYIIRLGADPNLVIVTGNTKYDQTYTDVGADEKAQLLEKWDWRKTTAGSIRSAAMASSMNWMTTAG